MRIVKNTPSGELELAVLGPGAIFGEMAMIDAEPRMATAIAAGQTVITYVDHKMFARKMENADPFVRALLHMLVKNVRSVSQRVRANVTDAERKAL